MNFKDDVEAVDALKAANERLMKKYKRVIFGQDHIIQQVLNHSYLVMDIAF